MPRITQPPHLRQLAVLAGDTRNELQQLASRQGLEGEGPEGVPGPSGPEGPEGKEGPPAATYIHSQGEASAVWKIKHEQKRKPSVVVIDTAGDVNEGDIEYPNVEEVILTFTGAFAGTAYLN